MRPELLVLLKFKEETCFLEAIVRLGVGTSPILCTLLLLNREFKWGFEEIR